LWVKERIMDGKRFDDWSRMLATPRSRRGVLGVLGAAVAGIVTGASAGAAPKADKPSKCYGGGSQCTNGKQCCSGICTNRQCEAESAPQCAVGADCPGSDTECQVRTCSNGICGTNNVPSGTVLATQTAGDCKTRVCDGNGGVTTTNDDADLPNDGNQCTDDICTAGVPSNPSKPAGTPCSQGGGTICNGSGTCVSDPCANLDDSNQCTADTCENGVPVHANLPAGTPCDQNGGQVCNGAGLCVVCVPGSTQSCYTGPSGTLGVGICAAGVQTCLPDGSGYGPCSGDVTPTAETCNGQDDNCNGVIDDNASCPPLPNATAVCSNGQCVVGSCNPGFANCDGIPANGCETNTVFNFQHCGSCGHVCPAGPNSSPVCQGGVCGLVCAPGFTNCNGNPLDGCECPPSATCQSGQCCTPTGGSPSFGAPCCGATFGNLCI
jgi:hypothetical protein